MKKTTGLLVLCAIIFTAASCGKRAIPPALLPHIPSEPEAAKYAQAEITDMNTMNETDEFGDVFFEDFYYPHRIIAPYTKEYLLPGQETRITVLLENAAYGDEALFEFSKEPGKNCIAVEGTNNTATVKAVKEGEQYLKISHPKAPESSFIVYDVLPPAPPPPPEIDVSESPLILRKGETRPLQMILRNGAAAGAADGGFQFQVVENAYAIEVRQHGDTLRITGIAPGAGKIHIQHPAALRDYDVMVIVD